MPEPATGKYAVFLLCDMLHPGIGQDEIERY